MCGICFVFVHDVLSSNKKIMFNLMEINFPLFTTSGWKNIILDIKTLDAGIEYLKYTTHLFSCTYYRYVESLNIL